MKEIYIYVLVISVFGYNSIEGKCNISSWKTSCDSLDVPLQVHQSTKMLTISYIEKTYLPRYLFRFSTVKVISITNCKIKIIREYTFVDLLVERLDIVRSGVEIVLPGAFKNLTHLATLSLYNNNLKIIEPEVFTKLPIKNLYLSNNLIRTIEDSAFSGLPNLKNLMLDYNKIESLIISKIIDDPSKLTNLDIFNNSLKTLTNSMLKGLVHLTVLIVGYNKIETIEEGAFQQTPKLQELVLRNNNIKELDGRIFPREGLRSLQRIALDNNELMYLSSNFFFRLIFLKKIALYGNPWFCSCWDSVSRILYDNNIKDILSYDYRHGKPMCVSDFYDCKCSYKYNSELSKEYFRVRDSIVVKKPARKRILRVLKPITDPSEENRILNVI